MTKDNFYLYQIDETNRSTVKFRVSGNNECGVGPFSPVLKVDLTGVPEAPEPIIVERNDCNLVFKWETPRDNGAKIT